MSIWAVLTQERLHANLTGGVFPIARLGRPRCLKGRDTSVRMACVAVAVVTGAGRGIGRAIALELSRRGLDVALIGRTETTLREAALEVERLGTAAIVVRANVADDAQVRRATADI